MGAHHSWRVVAILEDEAPGLGPRAAIRGAVMYHDIIPQDRDRPRSWGLQFPSPDDGNPLLDGERILGLTLLSRQRTNVSGRNIGEVRMLYPDLIPHPYLLASKYVG
jgi:hypothetical protein